MRGGEYGYGRDYRRARICTLLPSRGAWPLRTSRWVILRNSVHPEQLTSRWRIGTERRESNYAQRRRGAACRAHVRLAGLPDIKQLLDSLWKAGVPLPRDLTGECVGPRVHSRHSVKVRYLWLSTPRAAYPGRQEYPRWDSNPRLWLRRPVLYPLSYGGTPRNYTSCKIAQQGPT